MTVNLAVIGCGAATERYYVPALKKFEQRIGNLYLVDTNIAQAKNIAKVVGKGKVQVNFQKIIRNIEGAVIVVPHFLHHPIAVELLKAGISVLCEKPLAEEPYQTKEMVAAAKANHVHLCVNNTRRMFPNFKKIKAIIENGDLGHLKSIKYYEGDTYGWQSATDFYVNPRVSSKGILLDLGAHVVDTICWWIGKKPTLREYMDDSFGGPESVVSLKAESEKCDIEIVINRLCDLESRFEITGEKGKITGKPSDWFNLSVHMDSGQNIFERLSKSAKNYPEFVLPVVKNFLDVIEGKDKPLISGAEVEASIELIDECYKNRKRFTLPWYDLVNPSPNKAKSDKVLVTGASGFIGGRIIEMMHLKKNYLAKAGIHRWSSAARIGRFPVEFIQIDLMDSGSIENALDGVSAVVHCAKGTDEVTVQGTNNLLKKSLQKGIRRFVHLSTTEVYGNVNGEINEYTPFSYTGNAYNKSKIDAEKTCWEFSEKGLPIAILRPSIVYGPFSKNWTINFAKMFIAGKWGVFEGIGEGLCNLVYVDELVDAIFLALDHECARGQAFNIVGPDVVSWNEYFLLFNKSLNLPPLKKIAISKANIKSAMIQPVRILGSFVRSHLMGTAKKFSEMFEFADYLMRKTEETIKTTPHPDELKLFNKRAVYSCQKAREMLDFKPSIDVKEGLHLTAKWLRHQGITQ